MVSIKPCTTRKRRLLSLLLALLFLIPAEVSLASNIGDSLILGIQSNNTQAIRPLDPRDRDMLSVYNVVYDSLVRIDDDYLPQPSLCVSWETAGNGKTWTFHLRENVRFSDGTPLTANDVVASAKAILDRANDDATEDHGFYMNLKFFVDSISASDEETVVVKAKRRYYGLLYAMTFPVVPADRVTDDNPPGTGPYMISVFEPGDYMWLQTNPYWWQTKPQVKEIMVSLHDTAGALMESYEYARADCIFTRSLAAVQHTTGVNSLSMTYYTNQLECLLTNNSSYELTRNARYAIRYAIDIDKIISSVYMGMAIRSDLPARPGTWMYNDSLSGWFVRDVEKAKALLAEDGWEDSNEDGVLDKLNSDGKLVNLHLRFYVYEEPDNDVRVEAANMIADCLHEIGISCTPETLTFAAMQEKLSAGSFDLAMCGYAMDVCPDPGFLLMKGNTGNYFRYRNDEMTELCNKLRTCESRVEYQNTLYNIEALYAEDCPFICLYYRTGAVLSRYMYTIARDIREYELLRGIQSFPK